MRLEGPGTAELEGREPRKQRPGTADVRDSRDVLAEIRALSVSLDPRWNALRKLRASCKIHVHILGITADRIFKRGLDVCGSLAAILLLMPLFIVVAIWLKLDSPGPLIYRQVRIGQYGRPFYFYKFRSMYTDSEARRAALERENESAVGVIF